jgi:hypothetical protein
LRYRINNTWPSGVLLALGVLGRMNELHIVIRTSLHPTSSNNLAGNPSVTDHGGYFESEKMKTSFSHQPDDALNYQSVRRKQPSTVAQRLRLNYVEFVWKARATYALAIKSLTCSSKLGLAYWEDNASHQQFKLWRRYNQKKRWRIRKWDTVVFFFSIFPSFQVSYWEC